MNYNVDNIDDLLSLDQDSLLVLLAKEIDHGVLYANEQDKLSARQIAAEWINERRGVIKDKICTNIKIKKMVNTESDNKLLFIAVAEALSEIALGIPVATLSAILIKIGIANLCEETWVLQD